MDHTQQNTAILDQFGKQAAAYADLVLRNPISGLPEFLEAAAPAPVDRVLDVGCGTGRMAVALASLVQSVTGVDLTPAMLEQARFLQKGAGLSNVEWREADVTALPFDDGSFTLVTCRAMLHHTASPKSVLSEMRRVCAVGGRIAAADLTPQAGKAAAFDAIEILRDPSHVHAMPLDELRAVGASLGLTELALRPHASTLSIDALLATSFPGEGLLDKLRQLYRLDAESGADALGLGARLAGGTITVTYPSTLVVWTK